MALTSPFCTWKQDDNGPSVGSWDSRTDAAQESVFLGGKYLCRSERWDPFPCGVWRVTDLRGTLRLPHILVVKEGREF